VYEKTFFFAQNQLGMYVLTFHGSEWSNTGKFIAHIW
jgi:hypothetical protein